MKKNGLFGDARLAYYTPATPTATPTPPMPTPTPTGRPTLAPTPYISPQVTPQVTPALRYATPMTTQMPIYTPTVTPTMLPSEAAAPPVIGTPMQVNPETIGLEPPGTGPGGGGGTWPAPVERVSETAEPPAAILPTEGAKKPSWWFWLLIAGVGYFLLS